MKVAHLIMAYKEPEQIERLIKKMTYDGNNFYIHLDNKINNNPFLYLESNGLAKFTKSRFKVNWAGFSFTNAILECIREIYTYGDYDYINLLSGQDYPIKSNEYIQEYLSNNNTKCFMSLEAYGSEWWQAAKQRVERYHLTDYPFKGHYRIQQLLNLIAPIRRFPTEYILHGGDCATWWTLHKDCLNHIVDFIDDNPKIKQFAKLTWAPDEFLLPTIVMNSRFQTQIVNNNLRYIDWSLGGANPKILTTDDFYKLQQSDRLFARKFDIRVDSTVLDMLDELTE